MEFIQITDIEPAPKGGRHFKGGGLTPSIQPLTETSQKSESSNPIFNFSQDFIDNLQKITPIDLASSVPFVSLSSVDEQGKVLINFNLELFQKPIDFSKMGSKERFSDRPTASLVELKIKSDTASGYIFFQDISIVIKVHKPDIALNSTLIALLFPGMPCEIEYGWRNSTIKSNDPQKPHPLNTTEKLLFALKNYNINYNQDGQIDLTIDGTAFSERFNTTLLGDEGDKISELVDAKAQGKQKYRLKQQDLADVLNKDGLTAQYNQISNYIDYLRNLKDNPDKTGVRDMDLVEGMLQSYQTILETARGKTKENFSKNVKQLEQYRQEGGQYQEKKVKQQQIFRGGMITLHDLVSTLCEKTLDTFQKITKVEKMRVVYGLFHQEVGKNQGKFSGQPIADFPIDLALFRQKIGEYIEEGKEVLTVEGLFDIIIREFLHDTGYWKKLESTDEGVAIPSMYLAVNNYVVNGKRQMDVALVDINRDVPPTSGLIKGTGKLSVGDFEKKLRDAGIPVIKLGHGNSFIQNFKMDNISDQYIKSTLISRMAETSSTYTRSWIPPSLQNGIEGSDTKTPLHLPLQGSMTVLGSVDWKPFRAMGLISGLFIIDGVYKIMSVQHTISNGNFTTTMDILYH